MEGRFGWKAKSVKARHSLSRYLRDQFLIELK
jgi:hypothetical protein